MHMRSDDQIVKNLTLTMESYNRQLLRQTNMYSRIMGDLVRVSEKQNSLINEAPKESTFVDLIRINWDINTKLDSSASILSRMSADNLHKVIYIEDVAKR